MNATKPNTESISVKKKNKGECFSTKLKSTYKNSGTFEGKKILPEKVTYVPLAPSHSIIGLHKTVGEMHVEQLSHFPFHITIESFY